MLAKDHHVFTSTFPANKANLNAVLEALRAYPKCYDAKSNSYSLDKIAEWVIRKLEAFRQARLSGKSLTDAASPEEETQYVIPEVEAMRARLRTEEADAGPATERLKAIRLPKDEETTTDLPQELTGAPPGVPVSTGPLPADDDEYPTFQGLLAAEKAEYRIIELTRQNHKLNKENNRIQGELKLLNDSIAMLANTLGIEARDADSLDALIDRVAGISAVEQNLADVIVAFPPEVIELLEPNWRDKDILSTLRKAVGALIERAHRGLRDASHARESMAELEQKWQDAEQDLTVQRLQLLAENEELRTHLQSTQEELEQALKDQREVEAIADQRATSAQNKISELQEKHEHLNMNYLLLESDIERVKLERDKAIGMLDEQKDEVDTRVRQLEALRDDTSSLEEELSEARAAAQAKADEAEARTREIEDFRERFEGLEKDVEELTAANERLETTIREKDDEAEGVRIQMEDLREKAEALQAQLDEAMAAREAAEQNLGEALAGRVAGVEAPVEDDSVPVANAAEVGDAPAEETGIIDDGLGDEELVALPEEYQTADLSSWTFPAEFGSEPDEEEAEPDAEAEPEGTAEPEELVEEEAPEEEAPEEVFDDEEPEEEAEAEEASEPELTEEERRAMILADTAELGDAAELESELERVEAAEASEATTEEPSEDLMRALANAETLELGPPIRDFDDSPSGETALEEAPAEEAEAEEPEETPEPVEEPAAEEPPAEEEAEAPVDETAGEVQEPAPETDEPPTERMRSEGTGPEEIARQTDILREQKADLERRHADLLAQKKQAEELAAERAKEIKTHLTRLNVLRRRLGVIETEVESPSGPKGLHAVDEKVIEEVRSEVASLEADYESLERRSSDSKARIGSRAARIKEKVGPLEELREKVKIAEADRYAVLDERDAIREKLRERRSAAASGEGDHEELLGRIAELEKQIEEAGGDVEARRQDLERLRAEVARLETESEQATEALEKVREAIKTGRKDLGAARRKLKRQLERIETIEAEPDEPGKGGKGKKKKKKSRGKPKATRLADAKEKVKSFEDEEEEAAATVEKAEARLEETEERALQARKDLQLRRSELDDLEEELVEGVEEGPAAVDEDLTDELDALRERLAGLEDDASVQREVEELEEQMRDCDNRTVDVERRFAELSTKLRAMEDEVDRATRDSRSIEVEVAQIEARAEKALEEWEQAQDELSSLEQVGRGKPSSSRKSLERAGEILGNRIGVLEKICDGERAHLAEAETGALSQEEEARRLMAEICNLATTLGDPLPEGALPGESPPVDPNETSSFVPYADEAFEDDFSGGSVATEEKTEEPAGPGSDGDDEASTAPEEEAGSEAEETSAGADDDDTRSRRKKSGGIRGFMRAFGLGKGEGDEPSEDDF